MVVVSSRFINSAVLHDSGSNSNSNTMINLHCNSTASSYLPYVGYRIRVNFKPVNVGTFSSDRRSGCVNLKCEAASGSDSRLESVSKSSSFSAFELLKTSAAESEFSVLTLFYACCYIL